MKVKEFKLRKEFKEVVEVKRDGNRIEDWGLHREVQPLQQWAGEKERSRTKDKDWRPEALQGQPELADLSLTTPGVRGA